MDDSHDDDNYDNDVHKVNDDKRSVNRNRRGSSDDYKPSQNNSFAISIVIVMS